MPETVLSRQLDFPELALARNSYRLKHATEQFDAKGAASYGMGHCLPGCKQAPGIGSMVMSCL